MSNMFMNMNISKPYVNIPPSQITETNNNIYKYCNRISSSKTCMISTKPTQVKSSSFNNPQQSCKMSYAHYVRTYGITATSTQSIPNVCTRIFTK